MRARRCLPALILATMALLSLALAGCSARHPTGISSSGQIVLDFWNGFTGPDGKAMEEMIQAFEAANPDVRVRMQIIPWGTYYDKLTLSLAYGGAPDLFIVHAERLPEFAHFNTLEPLDDLFRSSAPGLSESQFAPAPWRSTFYSGHQYALPLDVHPLGLYYNTRLFGEAGIVGSDGRAKPPVTWQEFLDDARRLTRDPGNTGRPTQWGFVFTYQRSNWMTFAGQFGGGILSRDLKSGAMDSPESIQASQVMHDLIYRYHVAPRPEGTDAWLAFRQGKVAMALEGIYMLASLQEQKDLEFAGAPAPHFGPHPATWAGSHLLCMPAGIQPARKKAVWRLIRFLSEHSITWARGGQVPARLSVLHSPEFAALPVQSQFAKELPYVQYAPASPRINDIYPFVDPAVESVLLDLETPEAAGREATRRINQALRRP